MTGVPSESESALHRSQIAFAAHLRDPDRFPAPADVEARRIGVYRELFYNNIEGFLANTFPVLRKVTADAAWHGLVRDFYREHHSHTPLFLEIPHEFVAYLRDERESDEDPPYLSDLAHYEWVELALSVSDAQTDPENCDADGDLLDGHPLLSPLAWPLTYRYPVHRIGPGFPPPAPDETHLVVYRNRDDDVAFLAVNPITAQLLHLLSAEDNLSGRAALERIAGTLRHTDPAVVIEGGHQAMQALRARGILAGVAR
jgi:hypothetical protein